MRVVDFVSRISLVKQQFLKDRRCNPKHLLFPSLELIKNLQDLSTETIANPANDSDEKQQQENFVELILKLEALLSIIFELFEESKRFHLNEKIIICATVEYILADIYVNLRKKFTTLIQQLAQAAKRPGEAVAWVLRSGKKIDLMNLLISRISAIFLRSEDFYFEAAASKSPDLGNLAKGLRALSGVLIPMFLQVQAEVNGKSMTEQEQVSVFDRHLEVLDDRQQLLLRGLSLKDGQEPMHTALLERGARLLALRPGSKQISGQHLSFDEWVKQIDRALADAVWCSNPQDLIAFRFSFFAREWCDQMILLMDHPDKVSSGAGVLEQQFKGDRFFIQKTFIMQLRIFVDAEHQKLVRQELKQAEELAKFQKELGLDNPKKKAKKKKKGHRSKRPAHNEAPSFEENQAEGSELEMQSPLELSPEPNFGERRLRALQKSPGSLRKKINQLDELYQSIEMDINARVNFQLVRAEWLLSIDSTQFELAAQLVILEEWAEHSDHKEWVGPLIFQLDKKIDLSLPEIQFSKETAIILRILSRNLKSYVVGGFVRDQILAVENKDIDLVCLDDRGELYKNAEYHEELRQRLIDGIACDPSGITVKTIPDLERLLIIVIKGVRYDVFFSEAESLEEDARSRDFTMNALYLDQDAKLAYAPPEAIRHCKKMKCFAINPEEFFKDPVRLLRAIEHIYLKGFKFEDKKFKELFETEVLNLRQFNFDGFKIFLGEHEGHFMSRFTALLDKAAQVGKAGNILELFSLSLFSLLTPEQCMLLNKHEVYIELIRNRRSQAQLQNGCVFLPVSGKKALAITAPKAPSPR